jgi:TonB family protein
MKRFCQTQILFLALVALGVSSPMNEAAAAQEPRAQPAKSATALAAQLKDSDPEKRYGAAVQLRRLGSDALPALDALIQSLRDPDPEVAENAAWTLGLIGLRAGPAAPALTAMARDADDPNRLVAISALGMIRVPSSEVMKALIENLSHADPDFRKAAATALGALGPAARGGVAPLVRLIRDKDAAVRAGAVIALGRIGGGEALSALRDAEQDPNEDVRRDAALARRYVERALAQTNVAPQGASKPPTDAAVPIQSAASRPVRILSQEKPHYTAAASQRQISGKVILQVQFLATGKVGEVKVLSGLGYGLDEEAVRAAKSITFSPAEMNGRPIDRIMEIRYEFVSRGD